jgi:hypothetical protein
MSWFFKLLDTAGTNVAKVNSEGSVYTVGLPPSGTFYAVAAKTGTIAAAAAASASVFAMRLNPGYGGKAYVDRILLRWTTVVAFTVPITQTRSIVVTRGAGAAASGGTAIAAATKKDTGYGASNFDSATGGDMRIATTGALTVTGITFETVNLDELTLVHVGTAGAYYESLIDLTNSRGHPMEINPGEVLAIRVGPSAMDAAGTWSLGLKVAWRESTTEG